MQNLTSLQRRNVLLIWKVESKKQAGNTVSWKNQAETFKLNQSGSGNRYNAANVEVNVLCDSLVGKLAAEPLCNTIERNECN